MKEGFWNGLFEHLLFWSGWIFTVGGVIVGLWIGREYAWIGVLCVIVGLVALHSFAFQKYRHLAEARRIHSEEVSKFNDQVKALTERAVEAERRLNAIPADLLEGLHETIRRHSFAEVAQLLGQYAKYVERMKRSRIPDEKPIRLRTFVKRDGKLYAAAGLDKEGLAFLEQDDPFVLEFKDSGGLVTRSAHLLVHQKDLAKEVVWFRVVQFLGDEMTTLDALAEKQQVPGKGYHVRVEADLSQYSALNSSDFADVIQHLANEIVRRQG